MGKWFIVDMKEHETFVENLGPVTREEAEKAARDEYERFSGHDQRQRISFEAVLAEETEEGFLDWDSVSDYVTIK